MPKLCKLCVIPGYSPKPVLRDFLNGFAYCSESFSVKYTPFRKTGFVTKHNQFRLVLIYEHRNYCVTDHSNNNSKK